MSADQCEETVKGEQGSDREGGDWKDNHSPGNMRQSEEEQLEDGELEDGEIDEEPIFSQDNYNSNENVEQIDEDQSSHDKSKRSQREKRKKKRSKRERSQEGDSRKKAKKRRYVDHDRVENEDGSWGGEQQQQQQQQQHHHHHHHHHHGNNHHRQKYIDHDNMGGEGEMYDSSYDSPPGIYDSPSDGEGEERGSGPTSMLGLVQDDFMDVSISAQERQAGDMEQRPAKKMKKKHNKSKPQDGGNKNNARKTPLVELPRSERPYCKFFKEGKCSKGSTCPFNHDFQPPKRNDVCKFYLTSACNREKCLFMHSEFPCKYFHSGRGCYSGDECKFSHAELTEETQVYFDRMMYEEDMQQKKPSLLGSPPQHVIEEAERMKERIEHVKKIPSLFEIEVFPPGQSPRKSPQKNVSPPKRPSGFYSETGPPLHQQGPPQGPPMNNHGPPMNNQVPPMNNQGPPMNNMGPPMNNIGPPINNLGPPMPNMRPPMNNMGPPPMNNMGPPPPMNNMGPSPMNPMGAPPMNNLGPPPMINPGPRMNVPPPFPGGPDNPNNAQGSVLNMIGAILRTAAPLIVNQRSTQSTNNPPPLGTSDGLEESVHKEQDYSDNDQNYLEDTNISASSQAPASKEKLSFDGNRTRLNDSKDVLSEKMSNFQDEKEHKSASDPRQSRAPVSTHLLEFVPPPDSGLENRLKADTENKILADEKKSPLPNMDFGPKFEFSSLKDDNWYSSDEESGDEGDKLTVDQAPAANPVSSAPKASAINIMEMISNVKNDKSLTTSTSADVMPSFYSPSMTLSQTYTMKTEKDNDVPVTHCVLKNMLYRIKTFTLSSADKPYDKLPEDVNPVESRYQSDPRVQKYCQRLARKTASQAKGIVAEKKVERIQLPDLNLNSDGTLNLPKSRVIDPRMSRSSSTGSDESRSHTDPRVSHSDPRSQHNDPRSQHTDPRADPRSAHSDPRAAHTDPRAATKDPRAVTNDPRSISRSSSSDQRSNDPRSGDPRSGSQKSDPRTMSNSPRSDNPDPRVQSSIPRPADPRSMYSDPRMRKTQELNESAALSAKLNNLLTDPVEALRSASQRPDPRLSRTLSTEGNVQNKNTLDKSKSMEPKISGLSDFPSLLNRSNTDQYGMR